MQISLDGALAAAAMGFYANVEERKDELLKNKAWREQTLGCCWKAGQKAAERARGDGRTQINAADYAYGAGLISRAVNAAVRKAKTKNDKTIMAGIC